MDLVRPIPPGQFIQSLPLLAVQLDFPAHDVGIRNLIRSPISSAGDLENEECRSSRRAACPGEPQIWSGKSRHVGAMVLARVANRPTNPSPIGGRHTPGTSRLAFQSPNELVMYTDPDMGWEVSNPS
jgi:hypothetical protein